MAHHVVALRNKIRELEDELDKVRAERDQLQRENDRLKSELAYGKSDESPGWGMVQKVDDEVVDSIQEINDEVS